MQNVYVIQLRVVILTLNLTLINQHTGLATETDRNTHFHDYVNANTDIMKRQPYLEWKVNARMMEMCRLYLYKNCDKEQAFKGSVNIQISSPEYSH